jgi:hypothetical protein
MAKVRPGVPVININGNVVVKFHGSTFVPGAQCGRNFGENPAALRKEFCAILQDMNKLCSGWNSNPLNLLFPLHTLGA